MGNRGHWGGGDSKGQAVYVYWIFVNCNEDEIKANMFIEMFTVEEIAMKVNIFIELFLE